MKTWLVQVEVVSSGPETLAGGGIERDLRCCISGPGLFLVKRLRTPEFNDCWLMERDLAIGIAPPPPPPRDPPKDDVNAEAPLDLGAAENDAPADFATSGDDATDALVTDVDDDDVELVVVVGVAAFLATYF